MEPGCSIKSHMQISEQQWNADGRIGTRRKVAERIPKCFLDGNGYEHAICREKKGGIDTISQCEDADRIEKKY